MIYLLGMRRRYVLFDLPFVAAFTLSTHVTSHTVCVWRRRSRNHLCHYVWWVLGCLRSPTVTATYIVVWMMPECTTFTVHADCGVMRFPFNGGILKTFQEQTFAYTYYFPLLIIILIILLCFSSPLLLGISLGMFLLKKQPSPVIFGYILLYISLIRNIMHNIYTRVHS